MKNRLEQLQDELSRHQRKFGSLKELKEAAPYDDEALTELRVREYLLAEIKKLKGLSRYKH